MAAVDPDEYSMLSGSSRASLASPCITPEAAAGPQAPPQRAADTGGARRSSARTGKELVVLRIIRAEIYRDFDGYGYMDPFAVATWESHNGTKENMRTRTHWNSHMHPEWYHTCRAQPYEGHGCGDSVKFEVFEDNYLHMPTFVGGTTVLVDQLLESEGVRHDALHSELPLTLDGERTATVIVETRVVAEDVVSSRRLTVAGITQVDPGMFERAAKRIGVSGGTSTFFSLQLREGAAGGRPPDYYIGKDLSRCHDEVIFYEEARKLAASSKHKSMAAVVGFMFEYEGVLTCEIEGEPEKEMKELLVLRNLYCNSKRLRLVDLKIGQKTASAGWYGKTMTSAVQASVVDGVTNSSEQGFRLEGFEGPPPSLTSMNPMMDYKSDTATPQQMRKSFRMMLQRMTGAEVLMHFLDLHHLQAGPGDAPYDQLWSPSELAEVVLHEVARRLLELSLACQTLPVPQKWVGSSVAVAFDCGCLPPRSVSHADLLESVSVHLFDWGRSELNTLKKHHKLSTSEQDDRAKFWAYYCNGIDRLAWEAARAYSHRFRNTGSWNECIITLYDFDSHSQNDFIGRVRISPLQETPETTVVLRTDKDKDKMDATHSLPVGLSHGKDAPTLTYSVDYCALPRSSRLRGSWRVRVHRAANMPRCDVMTGRADVFAEVTAVDAHGQYCFRQQSAVLPNTLNPCWDEVFELPLAHEGSDHLEEMLAQASEYLAAPPLGPLFTCRADIAESLAVPSVAGAPLEELAFAEWKVRLERSAIRSSFESSGSSSWANFNTITTMQSAGCAVILIEQGPLWARGLALLASALSALASLVLILGAAFMRVHIRTAVTVFGLAVLNFSTVLFEVSPKAVQHFRNVNLYQDFLLHHAGGMRKVMGRGASYLLQGILWMEVSYGRPLLVALGACLCLVGALNTATHCKLLSRHVVRKLHRSRSNTTASTLTSSFPSPAAGGGQVEGNGHVELAPMNDNTNNNNDNHDNHDNSDNNKV